MKPEIKAKWVEALRSGEYKQGHSFLRNGHNYCCMGVLCDMHSKASGVAWEGNFYLGSSQYPPDVVAQWAGINTTVPRVGRFELAAHNDGSKGNTRREWKVRPKSFNAIAKLIEQHL